MSAGFPALLVPPEPPAVAARQRKNQKTDAKRRAGTQALATNAPAPVPTPGERLQTLARPALVPPPAPKAVPPAAAAGHPQGGNIEAIIAQAAAKHGISPDLLRAVGMQESGLGQSPAYDPVTGRSRTPGNQGHGYWQLDPASGAPPAVLQRAAADPAFAADYAAGMLANSLRQYGGDKVKALAAYNAGGVNPKGLAYAHQVLGRMGQGGAQSPSDGRNAPAANGAGGTSLSALPPRPIPQIGTGKNSTSDPIPQEALPSGPVPQYTPPAYTAPEYKPPAKGLEYLALGLGILFPGSPIARMAGGFASGLNEGADAAYQRTEQTTQDQYKAAVEKAQADFENAQAQRNAQGEVNTVKFHNASLQYQAAVDKRARGIDPRTNAPFVLPPQLQSVLPPGVKRAANAQDFVAFHAARADWFTRLGATDAAAREAAQAQDYQKYSLEELSAAKAFGLAQYHEQQQNAREDSRETAENAREYSRENAEDARNNARLAHEDARATTADAGKRATLRDEGLKAGQEFYAAWAKALKSPLNQNGAPQVVKTADGQTVYGDDGQPKMIPPAIMPQVAQQLSKVFSQIDRDPDPAGAANHYAELYPNARAKELLLLRGKAADLTRRAQGLPILPHAWPKSNASPGTGATKTGKVAHSPGKPDLYEYSDGTWKP